MLSRVSLRLNLISFLFATATDYRLLFLDPEVVLALRALGLL